MSIGDNPDVMRLVNIAVSEFEKQFGISAFASAVAPGRVEVLGNHTDYNGGYILSAAINMRTCVVAARQVGDEITMSLLAKNDKIDVALEALAHVDKHDWANYPYGVIDQLKKLDKPPKLSGMVLGIHGEVPIGAGLSSSAALEVATALAIQSIYPYDIDEMALAQLCQRAENQFVGVSSGLMDQFSSVFGEKDHFLFLDCLTLQHEAIASGDHAATLVVCNSMVKHALTGGEYNERRAECESAAHKLGTDMLRDVTLDMLEAGKDKLTKNEYMRAKHVVSENARVLHAKTAIRQGDLVTLGRLMNESHESSRTLFENSTVELDQLSELARDLPGCYGARLTGGGFGGCVLSLVDPAQTPAFSKEIVQRYGKIIGVKPDVFVCDIGAGGGIVPKEA